MVVDVWTSPRSSPLVLAGPPLVGLVALGVAAARGGRGFARARRLVREFTLALVVAFAYALVVGSTAWAKFNGFPRRYLIPSLMIWCVAWAALAVGSVPRRWLPRGAALAVALLVFPVAAWRFGAPAPWVARASLDRAMEGVWREVPPECTHVAGDYYRVWKVVLFSRMVGARPLWGLTYRREVTADLWDPRRFARPVGCFWVDDEPQGRHFLGISGFPEAARAEVRGAMKLVTRP